MEKKTILVVEDDGVLAKVAREELEDSGFSVVVAGDGEEAKTKLEKQKPDLILLDILLPKVGGLAFLHEIKADDATKDIPVIVLSNFSSMDTIARATELGAEGFLIKSNNKIGDVVSAVERKLEK